MVKRGHPTDTRQSAPSVHFSSSSPSPPRQLSTLDSRLSPKWPITIKSTTGTQSAFSSEKHQMALCLLRRYGGHVKRVTSIRPCQHDNPHNQRAITALPLSFSRFAPLFITPCLSPCSPSSASLRSHTIHSRLRQFAHFTVPLLVHLITILPKWNEPEK